MVKDGKLNLVQGYEQCGYDHADLEHESVVLRADLLEEAEKKAIENDDYTILPPDPNAAEVLGIELRETKIPNSSKYWPGWYRKEQEEKHKETNEVFGDFGNRRKDYNEIID